MRELSRVSSAPLRVENRTIRFESEDMSIDLKTKQAELKKLAPNLQCHIAVRISLFAGGGENTTWIIEGGVDAEGGTWEVALASARKTLEERSRAAEMRREIIEELRSMYERDPRALDLALQSLAAEVRNGQGIFVFAP